MNKEIPIRIRNKVASLGKECFYVCGNNDFRVVFDFDDEWDNLGTKTARFSYEGKYHDIIFEGNEVSVPYIIGTKYIDVGVFAGESSSTPIRVRAKESIVCGDGVPEEPPEDVYAQILEKCDEAVEIAKDVEQRANSGEFKGEKGDKGDSYVLTNSDKEEIAGMTSASLKAVYTKSFYCSQNTELPNMFQALIIGIEMIKGSEYDTMRAEFFDADGNTLAVVEGEGKHEVDIKGAVSANFFDEYSADGQFILKTYVPSSLGKEVGDVAEKSTEESKAYTDKKLGSLLRGSAQGSIIAIDDISPVSKEIKVGMSSKNLYYNTKDFTATFNGITAVGYFGTSEIHLNGTATIAAGKDVSKMTLAPGTYTFSVHGLNDTDKINLQNADTSKVVGTITTSTAKTVTFDVDTTLKFVIVITAGNSYEEQSIQIQIEEGLTATGYTPYFTEWDIAGVNVYGKNILYTTYEVGGLAGGNGNPYNNPAQIRSDFTPILPCNCYLYVNDKDYLINSVFFYDENAVMTKVFTTASGVSSKAFTADNMGIGTRYVRIRMVRADGADIVEEDLNRVKNALQLEIGTSATEYEHPVKPVCYEAWRLAESGGKIEGIYPNTTLIPEVGGVVMNVEYSRDLNKAFADLEQAIISLGGNV